jgi:hypothetical protein
MVGRVLDGNGITELLKGRYRLIGAVAVRLWGSPDSVDTDQGFTGVIVRAAMNACS